MTPDNSCTFGRLLGRAGCTETQGAPAPLPPDGGADAPGEQPALARAASKAAARDRRCIIRPLQQMVREAVF
jgi:hypothetical protein